MNDFEGLLSSDYGFKPQGKAAPMAPLKSTTTSSNSSTTTKINSSPFLDDHDTFFRPNPKPSPEDFSDLGGVFSINTKSFSSSSSNVDNNVNLDSIFGGGGGDSGPKFSSLPVFDKPVYDDEVSSSHKYEDIFSSSAKKGGGGGGGDAFDDLWGGLGKKEPLSARSGAGSKASEKSSIPGFDDLLPGFGSSINRTASDANKKTTSVTDDPFVVLESTSPPVSSSPGILTDPLEEIGNLNNSGKRNAENSSGTQFDDIDPLAGFANFVPSFSAEINVGEKDSNPFVAGARVSGRQTSVGGNANQKSSVRSHESVSEKKMPVEDYTEPSVFEVPSMSAETSWSVPNASSPVHSNASFRESNSHGHASPSSEENMGSSDDIWLIVSEVPLFTQPTAAPPPSRPPPPRPSHFSKAESGSFPASNVHKKVNDYSSFSGSVPNFQSPKVAPSGVKESFTSPLDELEEFVTGRNRSNEDKSSDVRSSEDFDSNSVAAASAAAMKEAMERAEAKFRHARGVRERENAKAFRSRDSIQVEKDEKLMYEAPERDFREQQQRMEHEQQKRDREEEEKRLREEEERRRIEKEWEEKEREKKRIERERELVERAAKEARERAAVEARARAERVAVQRVQAEARERAERAAVQRAQAEARERAAAGAKERAEKAAAEAREKVKAEAMKKEAREREAREKEASERAASAARANHQRNDNDLESFFNMGSRASSAPRPRATAANPFGTDQFQSKPAPEATRSSTNSSSSMRKASSSTNIVDDLSSIFGGPPSSNDFQELEGETEDRRRARMERHQRTQERAAKALAEKNARDLEVQREQAERYRIGETLDVEIRRWAAGREGNLRALLSTLQYVLWPECGWQPVSLTDLITGAAVKKVYRKATLCIHPDKVQQKGATLQQKYVAEKVFDLLKEAWNKFNSEELF